MKRRNVDVSKGRRPVKKIPKIYDGVYSNNLVIYIKLLLLWICVMGGDFMLEFRLEYLYPVYLLLHNSYEAYKFQGLAFALLLVCIVVSVDVICLGVIPAPFLYLLGSMSVWGQVGWSLTPLGPLLLLPTLIYIDGKSIRPPPSHHLTPLAAHCVGFPLVSLGFGLKSLIGARLKQLTRNDVARQNDVLYSLLQEALPFTATPVNNNEVISNGAVLLKPKPVAAVVGTTAVISPVQNGGTISRRKSLESDSKLESNGDIVMVNNASSSNHGTANSKHNSSTVSSSSNSSHNHTNSSYTSSNSSTPTPNNLAQGSNSTSSTTCSVATTRSDTSSTNSSSTVSGSNTSQYASPCPICAASLLAPKKKKDDCCIKLESEVRKLRSDLHVVRSTESDLRSQISTLLGSERVLRSDLASLQGEHESLQFKYSALSSRSQEERQSYEKKLNEEKRQKEAAINKQKKASLECSGDCKRKLRDADREKDSLRREIKLLEDKNMRMERELQNAQSNLLMEQKNKEVDSSAENARLLSHLSVLQDQNSQLESKLTAETRLKLDLFSALGEARRQVAIRDATIKSKQKELDDLRSQYVDLFPIGDFSPQQRQQFQPQMQHSLGQPQPSHHLKNLVSNGGDNSSQTSPVDNLSFSPLIES